MNNVPAVLARLFDGRVFVRRHNERTWHPVCPGCGEVVSQLWPNPLGAGRVCFDCMDSACSQLAEMEHDYRAEVY